MRSTGAVGKSFPNPGRGSVDNLKKKYEKTWEEGLWRKKEGD